MTKKQKKVLIRIIATFLLMVLLHFLPVNGWLAFGLYLVPYGMIGYDILRKAFLGIVHGEVFDENFLMAVATVGAMALGLYEELTVGGGEFAEGVAVMLFYQIGELFQSVAVGKSRKNITALMDIRPDYANVEKAKGVFEQVDPEGVAIGTIITVKPGEKIPIDGVVIEGSSILNTSALTGESLPREVAAGEEVISGCVNMSGLLKIQTTKDFGESTVSKILDLVENSSMKKSRTENFISRFAKYYTPAVCYSALVLGFLPPLVNLLLGKDMQFTVWLIRALTFLVISCPCALVISIPLSFFGGIGAAGAKGILLKGSNYLEALAKTKYVVFDKTGTLTKGVFKVTKVFAVCDSGVSNGEAEERLLGYAAYAESFSNHPISKSLLEAYHQEIDSSKITDVEEISGYGVIAQVSGIQVACGNRKLMDRLNVAYNEMEEAGTVVHVALDGEYAGYILIADEIKEGAKEALEKLKHAGVKETIMLTGDGKRAATQVAQALSINQVYSELLPQDKVERVEQLLGEKEKGALLAFVGDGINDAPVLTRADIGIAMGAMGSDAAIEAADVVLMDDCPEKIALGMQIARKCLGIVYQNIIFALGIKALFLGLGAFGYANMWMAIFADVGVMVLAVLNAIRCLHVKE